MAPLSNVSSAVFNEPTSVPGIALVQVLQILCLKVLSQAGLSFVFATDYGPAVTLRSCAQNRLMSNRQEATVTVFFPLRHFHFPGSFQFKIHAKDSRFKRPFSFAPSDTGMASEMYREAVLDALLLQTGENTSDRSVLIVGSEIICFLVPD